MTDAPVRVPSIRLDLIEEEALHSSNAGVMLQVEPADLLLMIAELRAARAAEPVLPPQYTGDEATVRCFLDSQLFAHEALDRLLAARAAPPADEVAGLLSDLHDLRVLALDNATTDHRRKSVAVRAARIENHLKGKR